MVQKICPIVSRGMEIQLWKRDQCMAWVAEDTFLNNQETQVTISARCTLLDQPLHPRS